MEGALKLKEISYIHAEAYPAGELKHGPLALVDNDMPVVTVAPNNELLEKLKSNLQEVRARGGQLVVFADEKAGMTNGEGTHVINMPHINDTLSPILYTIPLQLLSYYVAVLKGTDVDQPRNLATLLLIKSIVKSMSSSVVKRPIVKRIELCASSSLRPKACNT